MNEEKVILISTKDDLKLLLYEISLDVAKQVQMPKWVPVERACELLGIHEDTIRKWRFEGKIEFTQVSERIFLYSQAWIDNYLQSRAKKPFKK